LVEDNIFRDGAFPIHLDARGTNWQKVMVEDLQSELQKGLNAVPFTKTPYKNKYPHIANILVDDPGMPKYNSAKHNLIIGAKSLRIHSDAASGIELIGNNFRKKNIYLDIKIGN
jgi:hypothetical protein